MRLLPDRMMVSCESYFSQYQFIAGQLRGLIYRAMCPQLIKSNYVGFYYDDLDDFYSYLKIIIQILCQILDSSAGWDSKRIRSEQHDWIDKLSINCREVIERNIHAFILI